MDKASTIAVKEKKSKKREAKKKAPGIIAAPPVVEQIPLKHEERYLQDQLAQNPSGIKEKLQVEGRTFSYYLLRALSFTEIPVRNVRVLPQWNWLFFLLSIGSLALFAWGVLRGHWLVVATFATYLSISGLFYVPFMKLSLVADRAAYLPLLALAWGLGELYLRVENKYLQRAFWIWPVLFCLITFFVIREPRVEFPVL